MREYEEKLRAVGLQSSTSATKELVELFEGGHGALPLDYRNFLIRFNHAFFQDVVYFKSLESLYPERPTMEGVVSTFYGFRESKRSGDLRFAAETFADDLPPGLIPIGDNLLGDQLCLSVAGEHRGRIYFWDRDTGRRESRLPLIANSFNEFILSLYTKP